MNQTFILMYERLAHFLVEDLDLEEVSVILDAGCGSGKLTIPFVKKIMQMKRTFKLIAVDLSVGPYKGDLSILWENTQRYQLGSLVSTFRGDVRDLGLRNESVDLVVSNELFCDLDRKGLEKALREFHRILKPDGQMAHGELVPVSENEAQKLLIEADAHSLETMQPRPDWFSPFSDEIAVLMHKIGFKNIRVQYFETNVKIDSSKAIEKLKDWKISPSFIERRSPDIEKHGLEFPMEHIIFCEK